MSAGNYNNLSKNKNNFDNNHNIQRYERGNENDYEEVIVNNNLKNNIKIPVISIKNIPSKENSSFLTGLNTLSARNFSNLNSITQEDRTNSQFSSGVGLNLVPLKRENGVNENQIINNSNNNNIISFPTARANHNTINNNLTNSSNKNYGTNSHQVVKNTNGNGTYTPRAKVNNFQNIHSSTPQPKKINRSFDYFLKPPIKKGFFSYPKSTQTVTATYKENYKENITLPQSNKNHNNTLSQNNSNLNNNFGDSQMSLPRNFSDKYQINKNPSIANLTNKSVNQVDEQDSLISMKKNDSASSINFNKYKVGSVNISNADNISTSNLFGNNSNPEISTLFKNNQVVLHKNQSTPLKDKFYTFSNNDKTGSNNTNVNNTNAKENMNNLMTKSPSRNATIDDNTFMNFSSTPVKSGYNASAGLFKNKPRHEKESRRMMIEMVKINLREKSGNSNNIMENDISRVMEELKINKNILDRHPIYSLNASQNSTILANQSANYFYNNNNNNNNIQNSNANVNALSKVNNNNNNNNSDPYLTGSVEIKNNNFEINNNYFGAINSVTNQNNNNLSNVNMSKTVPQFLYNMDENSSDKINLLCFLAIPRILSMNIGSINSTSSLYHRVPFLFQLSPTNLCHAYGVEHYIFQWSDINTLAPVGTIDMLKIATCSVKPSNSNSGKEDNVFIIETSKEKSLGSATPSANMRFEYDSYEIISNNAEECKLYVNALNYLSQLIKCKAYAFRGNVKLNK